MPLSNLLSDKIPHLGRAIISNSARDDGCAPRGKLIEHAEIEITIKSERQRTRNRGCGHDQNIRLGRILVITTFAGFLHQLQALQNAETVLLVDDDQTGFRELDFLLQQRMSTDDKLRASLSDVAANFALAVGLERTGEQHDSISRILQNPARREVMLLRKNFSRCHQ